MTSLSVQFPGELVTPFKLSQTAYEVRIPASAIALWLYIGVSDRVSATAAGLLVMRDEPTVVAVHEDMTSLTIILLAGGARRDYEITLTRVEAKADGGNRNTPDGGMDITAR
jgi:hypothetical protein